MDVKKKHLGIKIFVIVFCILLLIYGGVVAIFAKDGSMPGHIYRDSLILGKTREEIIEIYGEPDQEFRANEIDYRINCVLSRYCYHRIIFDENGIAIDIDRHRNIT